MRQSLFWKCSCIIISWSSCNPMVSRDDDVNNIFARSYVFNIAAKNKGVLNCCKCESTVPASWIWNWQITCPFVILFQLVQINFTSFIHFLKAKGCESFHCIFFYWCWVKLIPHKLFDSLFVVWTAWMDSSIAYFLDWFLIGCTWMFVFCTIQNCQDVQYHIILYHCPHPCKDIVFSLSVQQFYTLSSCSNDIAIHGNVLEEIGCKNATCSQLHRFKNKFLNPMFCPDLCAPCPSLTPADWLVSAICYWTSWFGCLICLVGNGGSGKSWGAAIWW